MKGPMEATVLLSLIDGATFEDAADEAGISRRYGGIHFKNGDLSSRRMGREIGAECSKKVLTYFNGTASTPSS